MVLCQPTFLWLDEQDEPEECFTKSRLFHRRENPGHGQADQQKLQAWSSEDIISTNFHHKPFVRAGRWHVRAVVDWMAANKSSYGGPCHLLKSAPLGSWWAPQRCWRGCSIWWWCSLQAWSQVFLCIKRNTHCHLFVCFSVPVAEIRGERRKRTENTDQYSWLLVTVHAVLTTPWRINMNHVILSVILLSRRKDFNF